MNRSHLYFLQVEPNGPIKIGVTTGNPYARLAALQQSSPHVLKWIGYCPGDRKDETAAHHRLNGSRVRGEWFYPTAEVREFITEKCPNFDAEKARAEIFHEPVLQAVMPLIRPTYNYDYTVLNALLEAVGLTPYQFAAWTELRWSATPDVAQRASEFVRSYQSNGGTA